MLTLMIAPATSPPRHASPVAGLLLSAAVFVAAVVVIVVWTRRLRRDIGGSP